MTEQQKDCILEIQELLLAINAVVKKYELEDEFISCLAVGFIDYDTMYEDEDGQDRASMSLLSSFSAVDESELEDIMSYAMEAYLIQKEEEEKKPDPNSIDYWINLSRGDESLN